MVSNTVYIFNDKKENEKEINFCSCTSINNVLK